MERPMTTAQLFYRIKNILRKKDKLSYILQYGIATDNPVPIKTHQFELRHNLAYGEIRGIYLHLWIVYDDDGERQKKGLGTFKTLYISDAAMHAMAALLADFVIEECDYVNKNRDDFTWEGADVHPFDKDGKKISWGYTCGSMERALKVKEELLKKYPQVVVRDNATRKEKIFRRKIDEKD